MKSQARRVLLIILATLLVASAPACAPGEKSTPPSLTDQQVISIIQVYGVPHTNYYLKQHGQSLIGGTVNPVGQWAAVYEGNGKWRIQGAVVTSHYNVAYFSTTWIYREDVNEIRLIGFVPN